MTTTHDAKAPAKRPIDKEALLAKYIVERDKRLRADGNGQYLRVQGHLAHYLDDPYTPFTEREPKTDHVTFAFVGGGFAGLVTGARLVEAGVKDVRIVEKGGDFGGAWYWNRYPGAQCDTASMVYMPLLEETGHRPSEKYVHAPEILEQCQRIGRQYGLYDNALFHTEVSDLSWDEAASRWVICTNRGDAFTASFIGLGTGPLHVPKLPGIPGIETFKGHSFHTSRWDYDYTGGDPKGAPLAKLADKRVAIIGTGATAVQCVPHLARACGELYVFQRTPSSIDVRANAPIATGSRRSRRPAGSSAGWRTSPPIRPGARPKRTWSRTAGPICRAASAARSWSCRRKTARRGRCWRLTRTPTSRRWRRSAPAWTRSSPTARRRRR
jgi:thioredoxin reductase